MLTTIKKLFGRAKPRIVAATLYEGGEWLEFPLGPSPDRDGWRIHSLLFEDGNSFDALNGWRPTHCRKRATYIRRRDGSLCYWYANWRSKGRARGYVWRTNKDL